MKRRQDDGKGTCPDSVTNETLARLEEYLQNRLNPVTIEAYEFTTVASKDPNPEEVVIAREARKHLENFISRLRKEMKSLPRCQQHAVQSAEPLPDQTRNALNQARYNGVTRLCTFARTILTKEEFDMIRRVIAVVFLVLVSFSTLAGIVMAHQDTAPRVLSVSAPQSDEEQLVLLAKECKEGSGSSALATT